MNAAFLNISLPSELTPPQPFPVPQTRNFTRTLVHFNTSPIDSSYYNKRRGRLRTIPNRRMTGLRTGLAGYGPTTLVTGFTMEVAYVLGLREN